MSQCWGISDIYTLTRDHIIRMHRAVPLSCCASIESAVPRLFCVLAQSAARAGAYTPAILAVFFGPLARVVIETAPGARRLRRSAGGAFCGDCGYARLMSRRMNSRITAPMKATMIEPIMPPPVEIPSTPARNPPITAPTMPTMISTIRPNPPTLYDLSRQPAGDCSDNKPSDDPVFHPISPLFFLDELAAFFRG